VAELAGPPTVPLEAGIGPANPPCPVCGEPLFGWTTAPAGDPVRRCEACGLGVVGDPHGEAEALAALERLRVGGEEGPRYRISNRASLQAWLGVGGWAAIGGASHLFTPESVRRLVAARDQEMVEVRWRPGAGIAAMWGTILNSFTFGRNVLFGALGRAAVRPARAGWQRGLDWFIAIVTAPVVALVAVVLETGAAAAGRAGVVELTLRLE
jgi:hypothetical protein